MVERSHLDNSCPISHIVPGLPGIYLNLNSMAAPAAAPVCQQLRSVTPVSPEALIPRHTLCFKLHTSQIRATSESTQIVSKYVVCEDS